MALTFAADGSVHCDDPEEYGEEFAARFHPTSAQKRERVLVEVPHPTGSRLSGPLQLWVRREELAAHPEYRLVEHAESA